MQTIQEVLAAMAIGKVTLPQGQALIEKLTADAVAKARQESQGKLTCKVSQSGALSVYGLQRMPVTLHRSQWERLAGFMPEVLAFIKANAATWDAQAAARKAETEKKNAAAAVK